MHAARLHVVLGKGGVGKSTVSAALAFAAHHAGKRVLAVELDAQGGLSSALHAPPSEPGQIVAIPSGISFAVFEGSAALAEYLSHVVRLGSVLNVVFSHPLYKAFVAAAPGLRELLVIGKVRDELVLQKDGDRPRWDTLVLDAGTSGHALEHLRMPAAAAEAFGSGRVHRESRRVAGFLEDPARTRVHVVATPEEMPVLEAIEVIATLRELRLPLGELVMNGCRDRAPADAAAVLELLAREPSSPARSALSDVGRRALGWERVQEDAIREAEARTGLTPLRLPRVLEEPLGPTELATLGMWLEEVVA